MKIREKQRINEKKRELSKYNQTSRNKKEQFERKTN